MCDGQMKMREGGRGRGIGGAEREKEVEGRICDGQMKIGGRE
jgi:hypothetical protein